MIFCESFWQQRAPSACANDCVGACVTLRTQQHPPPAGCMPATTNATAGDVTNARIVGTTKCRGLFIRRLMDKTLHRFPLSPLRPPFTPGFNIGMAALLSELGSGMNLSRNVLRAHSDNINAGVSERGCSTRQVCWCKVLSINRPATPSMGRSLCIHIDRYILCKTFESRELGDASLVRN